eukprot:65197-Hanusia_phi.AAC.1
MVNQTLSAGSYTVEVGKGGAGTRGTNANDGISSGIKQGSSYVTLDGITLEGKGGGRGAYVSYIGGNGGSGGGGGGQGTNTYGGTTTQGNTLWNKTTNTYQAGGHDGGNGSLLDWNGNVGSLTTGGGGGAGSVGASSTTSGTLKCGDGGDGVFIDITGTSLLYATGGGG